MRSALPKLFATLLLLFPLIRGQGLDPGQHQVTREQPMPELMPGQSIIIRALPGTDLWRKPPNIDSKNAPTVLLPPIDLHNFFSARVTVSGNWSTLYDQGGLALFLVDQDIQKWVKTGIEFVNGKAYVGTVATDQWSDWSLVPLAEGGKVTIQVEREMKDGKRAESLWVYVIDEQTKTKTGIREVTWWFLQDPSPQENLKVKPRANAKMLLGVYAARPTTPGVGRENEELVVKLDGFEIKFFDD